jgi:hypothetical protein
MQMPEMLIDYQFATKEQENPYFNLNMNEPAMQYPAPKFSTMKPLDRSISHEVLF